MSACCDGDGGGTGSERADLIVLGAGSAGISAAITAAEQGAHVALVGYGTLGGTCVNVGCVPSKTMIRAMECVHQGRAAARFAGLEGAVGIRHWASVVAQKEELVDQLRQAKYADVLAAYDGVSYVTGRARLSDGGVAVNGWQVAAPHTIVATGARAAVPEIPGLDAIPYLTSTTALELDELPRTLVVLGAGYIGCELAQMFARAGVAVTLVCRHRLLPEAEPEIGACLKTCFQDEGITVVDGVRYRSVRQAGGLLQLDVETGEGAETLAAEKLLVAAGRAPNVAGLGLEQAGIALTQDGGIRIDAQMRTSRPGVYAAGDVTGEDQFVYMAAYGGRIAAENALNGDSLSYDNTAMPAVTFTDPQAASVGLTEAAAKAAGMAVKTSVLGLDHVPRALAARDTRGLIKLVADAATDRLLGAHVLAPEGADSIQTAALAIRAGMTVRELAGMIFPYLTTVEGLKLAAQTFDKDVSRLSCCAG